MADLTISYPDDETMEIFAKGVSVGTFNHDEHGWAGMTGVKDLVGRIACELYLSVDEEGEACV